MMNLTTMNPATRRLIKVMPDDAERTAQVFDLLLGDNLTGRKESHCGIWPSVRGRSRRELRKEETECRKRRTDRTGRPAPPRAV